MKKNLYVDVNIIQTVPSSNINRDDTGMQKTALYGGTLRTRVSSQSWKKAVRDGFKEDYSGDELYSSYRTKRGVSLLAKQLMKDDKKLTDEEAEKASLDFFATLGLIKASAKRDKKTKEYLTGSLLMLSQAQLEAMSKLILKNGNLLKDKKLAKEFAKQAKSVLTKSNSADIALFGRMVADDTDLNVGASCQVAHALSVNSAQIEYDYFTAVDDLSNTQGSAMIGSVPFSSATLYRYANVNVNQLIKNLNKDLAPDVTAKFVKEFIMRMPTGYQNSFANNTLPDYVLITVRGDAPVNLVSAFEKPIESTDGYTDPAINRLEDEDKKVETFVGKPLAQFVIDTRHPKASMDEVLSKLADSLKDAIDNENNQITA